jgi:hypothetical protein
MPTDHGAVLRALGRYSQPQIRSVMQDCRAYAVKAFPVLSLSPARRVQLQQQLVKFAQCLGSHGVNLPDPTSTNGGGLRFFQALHALDHNSPAFRSALAACRSLQPHFGPPTR